VVSAGQRAVVQTAARRAGASRAAQPVQIVIDPPKRGGASSNPASGERSDNPEADHADFLPDAGPATGPEIGPETGIAPVSPVSLDEAISLSLSPPQRMAIQLLTSGQSLVAAATAAGVNRTTLYRWLKGDPAFVAAYNAWQKDVRDTARGKVLALSDLAITTIAKAMTRGDTRSALKILQATGALTHQEPGSTDPVEIDRLQKLERLKAQTALQHAENKAEMDADLPL
jgi:hypothetical protein